MNFEALKSRVERAEALVDGRMDQTGERYTALKRSWREAWTPPRIIIAGLVAGFVSGRAQPRDTLQKLGRLGGPKAIQMVSSLATMLTSLQAAVAAATAEKAANTADDAADDVQQAAEAVKQDADVAAAESSAEAPASTPAVSVDDVDNDLPRPDRNRPDAGFEAQPRPAEAATEISESGR